MTRSSVASEDQALFLAASAEDGSEHPIARAIVAGARDRGVRPAVAESFANSEGLGVEGVVDGRVVVAGREQFLADRSLTIGSELVDAREAAEVEGRTAVFVGWDGRARAVLVVSDTVRPTSAEAVAGLGRLGLRTVLLTGDNARAARAVAAQVRYRRSGRQRAAGGQGGGRAPAAVRWARRRHGGRRHQ